MPPPRSLFFVTSNANKLAEAKTILGETGVNIESKSVEIPEIQGTIEEIAKDKARRAAEKVNGPVLVEDTSLCFNALKGLPGPYVKHFVKDLGNDGLVKLLAAYDDKTAQAVCTFAYCEGPGKEPILFEGRTNGKIVRQRGEALFGWDPIFEYEGSTFAEMDKFKKNKISHRFKALQKLKEWLEEKDGSGKTGGGSAPAPKRVDRRNLGGHDDSDGGSFFDSFGAEVKPRAINIAGDGMGIRKATGRTWDAHEPE